MTRLRGLVALVVVVAFVVGVPGLLVRYGDWPITGIPSGDQLRDLTDTVVSDSMVFAVLTVAAWVVWAVFTLSILVETTAAVRGVQAPRLAFVGPLQRSARVLVAAIVLAITISHSQPPAVAATAGVHIAEPVSRHVGHLALSDTPTEPSVPVLSSSTADDDIGTASASPVGGGPVIVVARGDSAWSLADEHLGDGMRWRELWSLNHDRPQPDGRAWIDPQVIRPGWQLVLPSDGGDPASAAPDAVASVDAYVVARGDTLSDIARDRLGDPRRYVEIFELNRDVEQPDGRHLTDPSLILPGWQLRLPVSTPTSDTIDPVPPSTTTAQPAPPTTAPDIVVAPDPAATVDTNEPEETATAPTVEHESPEPPPPSPSSTTILDDPASAVPADPQADDESWWDSTAMVLAGVTGAVVLASGLLMRMRRAQKHRSTRGARARREIASDVERAVVAAADVPLVRWAGQALADLVTHLDTDSATRSAPLAIEVCQEQGIELLWEAPSPSAPEPWTVADEGWTWHLAYDPDGPVPLDALPAGIPGLVTIGQREGRQLLVDLEAFGSVAVTGDAQRVEDFLRSLALELSTGDDLADAYAVTIDLDAGTTGDRLSSTDAVEATSRLESISQSVQAALDAASLPTTFAYRCGGDGAHLEVTVVIATLDAAGPHGLLAAAVPRRGVAIVASGVDAERSGAHVHINADGTARLEPLGLTFGAAGVPAESASAVNAVIEDIDEDHGTGLLDPSGNGHDPRPLPSEHVSTSTNGDGHERPRRFDVNGSAALFDPDELDATTEEAEAASPVSPLDAALVVKVLGTPRVPDRPDLKRREVILTAYLACRGGQVNASAIQDALWNGQAIQGKTLWNLVGRTRTALGQLPDGTWVLPPSDRNRRMKGLAAGVTTDLAILGYLYEQAQAAPSSEAIGLLRQGLALVEGPPFDADGYDWAHHGTQDVAEASRLIEQATEQLVELALDLNDIEAARWAITQGLRGLPGDEVLYRLRMRVEHHAGNLQGVTAAYDELLRYLVEFDAEPSPSTLELHRELVARVQR